MSNIYEMKIQNHQKFNVDDIKNFCMDQARKNNLSDYITDFTIKKILFGLAGYDEELHLVSLNTEFIKQYKDYKREFKPKNILDRILILDADVFNLFIMESIYHEIYHAKQIKEINENSNSDYSTLIKASYLFVPKSGTSYNCYHNRYFVEYDAIINSILFIIDYTKEFNIDKRALFLLNKTWAVDILKAYGIDLEGNIYNEYTSPIDFFRYFFDEKFYIEDDEKAIIDRLENSITNYKPDNDIDALIRGYPVSIPFIEKLFEIADGKVNTTNIFAELSFIEEKMQKRQ